MRRFALVLLLLLLPVFAHAGNLITNGDFAAETAGSELASTANCTDPLDDQDVTTGWTGIDCTLDSIAGGETGNCLEFTRTDGANQQSYDDRAFTAGQPYKIVVSVKEGTATDKSYQFGIAERGVAWSVNTTGTATGSWVPVTLYGIATAATDSIMLEKSSAHAGTLLFDNVSVKTITLDDWTEGTGWHANGGTAKCDGSQSAASLLLQPDILTAGIRYKVIYDVIGYSAGTVAIGILAGSELHDDANAASDPNGSEADDTAGWTSAFLSGTGTNVFESAVVAGDTGSWSLHGNANNTPTGGARFTKDIETDWSLVIGKTYKLTFDWRHVGAGDIWSAKFGSNSTLGAFTVASITNATTTFTSVTVYFVYTSAHKYLGFREDSGSSNNGGVYVDNLSCKNVSLGTVRSADGTYTEYVTAVGADFVLAADADFIGEIDNVSVEPAMASGPLGSSTFIIIR